MCNYRVQKRKGSNFAELLLQRLGENSLLIDAATGQTFGGRDLPDWIVGSAIGLLSAGLLPGDRLLVNCSVSPASMLTYLGAMYAGIIPLLVDERLLESKGASLAARSRAKAIWSLKRMRADWAQRLLQMEGTLQARPARSLAPAQVGDDDVAVLMPTSGSTGTPQLVVVSHGNLRANTEAIVRSQRLGSDERAMLIMPASYCFGASVVHSHLYQGGSVVFDSRFMFPDKVLRAIDAYRCTTFAGVPAVYNILLRRSSLRTQPLGSLRRFLQAGGALATDSVRELCDILPEGEFFAMYGQTEATARIASLPVVRAREKLGSVGQPLDNLKVRVVDENDKELSTGEVGEILVRGPSVCSQYFDDPESSARKFNDGWLKTGDFGRLDADGYLWITGRTDDFIKIRGFRVGSGEVEERVAAIPGVYECAAVGVKHAEAGEALALFVVAENDANGLAEKVRLSLPPLWTCASVNVVAALPRTSNGKVARSQLRTLA
jgi:acyl-CoA synthetase (AMP-forming)/AMP-acid ligase II